MSFISTDKEKKTLITSTKKNILLICLGILIINLASAFFTQLSDDEAYYWQWSHHLSFGYFDHPPMIAFMISIGRFFFEGELGVRIMSSLFMIGTMLLLYKMLKQVLSTQVNIGVFAIIFMGFPVFEFFGFIATPDSPLIFFSTLFLYLFHSFLERKTWTNTILLGISMAFIMYSKYHGVLLITFVCLAHIKQLFRNPKFFIACLIGLICYIPHLLWLYDNDFITIQYHLQRGSDRFKFKHLTNYFVSLISILNPLFFVIILMSIKTLKTSIHKHFQPEFHRSSLFIIIGFLSFFLYQSFNILVQAQWMSILSIPIFFYIILLSLYKRKLLIGTALLSFIGFIGIRIYLAIDIPTSWSEFHNGIQFANTIEKQANGRPVLFINNYGRTAKYAFYANHPKTVSHNGWTFRKNQHDLWDFLVEELQGKDFFAVEAHRYYPEKMQLTNTWEYSGFTLKNYQVYQKCKANILNMDYSDTLLSMDIDFFNPYDREINIGNHPSKTRFKFAVYTPNDSLYVFNSFVSRDYSVKKDESIKITLKAPPPEPIIKGSKLSVSIYSRNAPPLNLSKKIKY